VLGELAFVSSTVKDLVAGSPLIFQDHGEHVLKDADLTIFAKLSCALARTRRSGLTTAA